MIYSALDLTKLKIQDHIKRVKYFGKMAQKLGYFTNDEMFNNAINAHDADKMIPINLLGHSKRLLVNPSSKDSDFISKIRDKHYHSNAHHPEYWSKSKVSFLNCVDATRMPNLYLTEMCCDWSAVNEEFGTTSLDWYNKSIDTRFIFSECQKEYIKNCLTDLGIYSILSAKRTYTIRSGVEYANPCIDTLLKFNAYYKDKSITSCLHNDLLIILLDNYPLIKFKIKKESLITDRLEEIKFSSSDVKSELKNIITSRL